MAAGSIVIVSKPTFQTRRSSLNLQVEEIYRIVNNSKRNKQHIARFNALVKQIIQALSGADGNFLRRAEFYQDLLETLNKLHSHVLASSKRKSIARFLMAKKDDRTLNEMQKHVDTLCGRIFLSYAQRMEKRMATSIRSLNKV